MFTEHLNISWLVRDENLQNHHTILYVDRQPRCQASLPTYLYRVDIVLLEFS